MTIVREGDNEALHLALYADKRKITKKEEN